MQNPLHVVANNGYLFGTCWGFLQNTDLEIKMRRSKQEERCGLGNCDSQFCECTMGYKQ